eukprot:g1270.t1
MAQHRKSRAMSHYQDFSPLGTRVSTMLEEMRAYNSKIDAEGLTEDKISEATMTALQHNSVDKDMLDEMDGSDWGALGLKVGEKRVLVSWMAKCMEDKRDANKDWYQVAPASLTFNLASWALGFIMHIPAAIIGIMADWDEGCWDPAGKNIGDCADPWLTVFVPAVVLTLVTMVLLGMFRLELGKDLLEEASQGIDVKEVQRSNMTNTAVVGALLLTVVVAMLQADQPALMDSPFRFLSQWYTVFNLIGTLWCFTATTLSVLLLMYIEPLDAESALIFVCKFLDYVGEPVGCILVAVWFFMNAAILWVFGTYGAQTGIVAAVCCAIVMQRVVLTYLYLSAFKNPLLSHEERSARQARMAESNMLDANLGFLKRQDSKKPKAIQMNPVSGAQTSIPHTSMGEVTEA